MHIPTEESRTEAKALFCDAEELLLGHDLATEDTIAVNAGDLDLDVVGEEWRGIQR